MLSSKLTHTLCRDIVYGTFMNMYVKYTSPQERFHLHAHARKKEVLFFEDKDSQKKNIPPRISIYHFKRKKEPNNQNTK